MPSDVNHSHTTEERLSRLEATVETFVLTVSKDIQDQNSNINALRKAIQEQVKTPWQNYIGAAGVFLIFVGLFGSVYLRDLRRTEGDLDRYNEWRVMYSVEDARDIAEHRERLIALEREVFEEHRHSMLDRQ